MPSERFSSRFFATLNKFRDSIARGVTVISVSSNLMGIIWSLNLCVYKINKLKLLSDDSPEPSLTIIYSLHNTKILLFVFPQFKIKLMFLFSTSASTYPWCGKVNQEKMIVLSLSLSLFGSFSIPKQKSWWEKKLPCCIYNLSTRKHCGSNHKIWEVSLISTTVLWRISNRRECVS